MPTQITQADGFILTKQQLYRSIHFLFCSMKLSQKRLWNIAYILLFIISIVLCIRLVHEPDLWWQTRTGEYILQHKTIPDTDVFSFTYDGKPWLNVKWGFEVIQASVVKWFGAEFLPLTQVFANIFLLLTLFITFREFEGTFKLNRFAKFLTLLLLLVGLSYRMNGRPELTTYLFTAIYLMVFLMHYRGKSNWLFVLIPLQLLWTNLHEAYGVGMVMLLIFLAAQWFVFFQQKIKSAQRTKQRNLETLIVFLALFSVVLHPSGTRMLFHPYEIFTQLSENQFTTEIFGANKKEYWQLPAFISVLFLLLSALQLWKIGTLKGKFSLKNLFEKVPLFYVLLYAAFFYLSLKSYRNIPFFIIVATPFVAAKIFNVTSTLSQKTSFAISVILGIAFYFSIVTNSFYKTFLPAEEYGLGINPHKNALGAARFLAENKINGNGFTDYLGSSFLLWKLQPNFRTFVDLRDLDVFDAEDMEIAISCCTNPERQTQDGTRIWDVVSTYYNFNYVAVINHPQFKNLHRYLIQNKKFELVYGDELISVYLKNNPENEALISKFGFSVTGDVFRPIEAMKPSKTASFFSRVFWPFHKIESPSTKNQNLVRQSYYSYIGLSPK